MKEGPEENTLDPNAPFYISTKTDARDIHDRREGGENPAMKRRAPRPWVLSLRHGSNTEKRRKTALTNIWYLSSPHRRNCKKPGRNLPISFSAATARLMPFTISRRASPHTLPSTITVPQQAA